MEIYTIREKLGSLGENCTLVSSDGGMVLSHENWKIVAKLYYVIDIVWFGVSVHIQTSFCTFVVNSHTLVLECKSL